MLDFRRKSKTPNYLARPLQFRLLLLVMVAGLLVILIGQAARPANWRWLLLGEPPGQVDQAGQAAPETRLKPPKLSPDVPDAFIAIDNVDSDARNADDAAGAEAPSDAALMAEANAPTSNTTANTATNQTESPAKPDTFFPGVRSEHLSSVRDDAVLRGVEHDAWFHLLDLLERNDDESLRAASTGNVGYVQLFKQPKEYRGRLVTVRGVVRGVRKLPAAKNAYGIDDYFQLSLEPDGGPAYPIIIYALHLPTGFPEGMKVAAECSATGFFYKRWAYQAQDGIHTAPLILARSVEWQPPAAVEPFAAPDSEMLLWIAAGSAGAAVLLVALFWRLARRPSRVADSLHGDSPANLNETLRGAELAPTVEENLRELSERAKP